MKINFRVNGATLDIQSRGNIVRIDVSFRPSQQPNFTDFLDDMYELRRAVSNEDESGYYSLYIEDPQFKNLIYSITKGAEACIDLSNPANHTHVGPKETTIIL